MELNKGKKNIKINAENCAQCLSCMLTCSFIKTRNFNVSKSSIIIYPGYFEGEKWIETTIKFLDSCRPNCRACVRNCIYNALEYIGGD
ncbi:MAG: hypothetical protein GF329_04905 [Candidatus Lokiarchaeota archaeon]|nr:hypothetical protein [Candidatus Lokiarchaeota archaeon]